MQIIFSLLTILALFGSKAYASAEIDSYFRYLPARSVEAMPGKVEIMEGSAEYSYEVKAFDKLPVKFSLATEYLGIENTVAVELPAHLTGLSADIETTLSFFNFKETYFRLGISPSFYGDDWDFTASNFRIPSRYFVIYRPSDKLTLLGGVAIYPDFENELLPILGFIYQPNEKLTFNIIPKRPDISYSVNDRVTLFAEGGSSFNREFEVTQDSSKNVVLRYRETHLGGGIKFKVNKFIRSSISAGAIFNRSLRYRDSLGKVNIKDGLYSEFRIEAEF